MFAPFANLNWLAILVAVVAFFVLGGLWFKFVVGGLYVAALGREQKSGAAALVGPLVCLSILTVTSAVLIRSLGINTYRTAAEFGLVVGLGYLLPMIVNISINPLFLRPFLYSAINAPFFVGGSVLVSLILTAFG